MANAREIITHQLCTARSWWCTCTTK